MSGYLCLSVYVSVYWGIPAEDFYKCIPNVLLVAVVVEMHVHAFVHVCD